LLTRGLRKLAGERDPALQQRGGLWVGEERRQVIRPQGEIAARQLVGIVHCRHYRAASLHPPSLRHTSRAIDDAKPPNRGIVAEQHYRWRGLPGA
jgi:hypothetical protein